MKSSSTPAVNENSLNLILEDVSSPSSPFVDDDTFFVGRFSETRPSSSPFKKSLDIILSPTDDQTRVEALGRLNLGSFLQWILCFCVVDFDLEIGQAMELVYPPISFSSEETKTICFSAFPDSNSTEHLGDSTFSFRMRNSLMTSQIYRKEVIPRFVHSHEIDQGESNTQTSKHSHPGLPIETDGYTYGYVFFRQKRDSEVRRGFFQKSLVILTPYPWHGFFLYLLNIVGPQVMDSLVADRRNSQNGVQNIALFETACFNISSWPSPPSLLSPEVHFSSIIRPVHFLGHADMFSFPPHCRFPQLYEKVPVSTDRITSTSSAPLLCNPSRIYQVFSRSMEYLWLCWELMMVGAPLLVMADTPQSASETVWALIELIKPIPFGGDFRPYFTIQDTDFTGLASASRVPAQGTLLGVTNMVFSKLLDNWPNVMRVSRASTQASNNTSSQFPRSSNPVGRDSSSHAPHSANPRPTIRSVINESFFLQIEKFASKHRTFFAKDKKLLKDVLEAAMTGMSTEAANNMIRRHFVELTERFLQPLNRYFETLVTGNPSLMNLSCLRSKPDIKAFHQDRFLKMIEQNTPSLPLTAKRPVLDFYRMFLMSPNFALWLQHKTTEVHRGWRETYLQILCFSDVTEYISKKLQENEQVECIDLFLRLREEVDKYSEYFVVDGETVLYADLPGNPSNKTSSGDIRTSRSRSASGTVSRSSSPIPPQTASIHLARNERGSIGGIDLSSLRISSPDKNNILLKERSMTPPPSMTLGTNAISPGPSPLRVPLARGRHSSDSNSMSNPSSVGTGYTDSVSSKTSSYMNSAAGSTVSSPARITTTAPSPRTLGTNSLSRAVNSSIPTSRSANSLLGSRQQPVSEYPIPLPVSPVGTPPSIGSFIPSTTHFAKMKEQLAAVKAALPPELRVTVPLQ